MPNLKTPLYDSHVAAGARIVEFAGYDMPVQYASVIGEAKAVREGAGMFDVSHMARLRVDGPSALAFLERVTSNDVAALAAGTGQYSLLPNNTGGVVDDIIVYRVSEDSFRVVVNASNHQKDVAWMEQNRPIDVTITDDTATTAMIAVQGPRAVDIVADLSDKPETIRNLPTFGLADAVVAGVSVWLARSGYTGEDGLEIVPAAADAAHLWDALVAAGVAPCGLASRDTLRVEAGLPLYGHELTDEIDPVSAGLGWVVSKTKDFIGSGPIAQLRDSGTTHRLMGLRLNVKRLPAAGMTVRVGGEDVGYVTSGVYSPLLDAGIGFAYIRKDIKANTQGSLDFRGREETVTIVNKRFLKAARAK